jgi:hypothetical protein
VGSLGPTLLCLAGRGRGSPDALSRPDESM